QHGIGKCGSDVVGGARLAVGSDGEEIVAARVRRDVILVDAGEHENAGRLVVDVEQPEGNRLAHQLLERGRVSAGSFALTRPRTRPAPAMASCACWMVPDAAPFVKYAFPPRIAATR